MPLNKTLLYRLKVNDPTLTILDLHNKKLDDTDIKQLAEALTINTTLTALDVSQNKIKAKGAQVLAMALAANQTLTSLNMENNQIGAKGAKALVTALAANQTLTLLNVKRNRVGDEWEGKLEVLIESNQRQQQRRRRDQFIHTLVVLAQDHINPNSRSLWATLPLELISFILSFLPFTGPYSIGKTDQQVYSCIEFLFNHISNLRIHLQRGESFQVKENTWLSLHDSYNQRFTLAFFKPSTSPKIHRKAPSGHSKGIDNNTNALYPSQASVTTPSVAESARGLQWKPR